MSVKTKAQGELLFSTPVQKFTTDERDVLDLDVSESAYIIYNTTTSQFEYTVDGISWLSL